MGDPGPPGSGPGLSDVEYVHTTTHCSGLPGFKLCDLVVFCSPGKSVLGGGVSADGFVVFPPTMVQSAPITPIGWFGQIVNNELIDVDGTCKGRTPTWPRNGPG